MGIRDLTIYGERKEWARILRKDQTLAEKRLWLRLRRRQLNGLKFRRQFPLGPFFADFCCLEKRIVVEIDGEIHTQTEDHDRNRTTYLIQQGFRVLRFRNQQVLSDLETVCHQIVEGCLPLGPLPSGEGGPPKAVGEA